MLSNCEYYSIFINAAKANAERGSGYEKYRAKSFGREA
jgi:hypothetical protein